MERRQFLINVASVTAVGASLAPEVQATAEKSVPSKPVPHIPFDGLTPQAEFKLGDEDWKVYEDLSKRDGPIVFVSSKGTQRVLGKHAETNFAESNPPYLGLKLSDIGTAGPDLLADELLKDGEPNEEKVRSAAPPIGSAPRNPSFPNARVTWNTIVGTVECSDTMPVYPSGNTRTYHPNQYLPEITAELAAKRYEGLLGGYMPAVLKVMPLSETAHIELIIFGDVQAKDKFIVQTWHRSARIENGKITKVVYGYSYPAYPPARTDPDASDFYRALLVFADYWEKQIADMSPTTLPDNVWDNMTRYAIVKELMVRPGGIYPKYGAVDRDYYGPEYDGFQDIFTMSVYTNLEWGRFEVTRRIIDNYFTDFVDAKGNVNMRGPETGQYGLTLSLLARYYNYTRDKTLFNQHKDKIVATAALLAAMHDESLKLPKEDVSYGLIRGWSESDACLAPKPDTWWQPYFANSAFAARGFRDLGRVWTQIYGSRGESPKQASDWATRSRLLEQATIKGIEKSTRSDMKPPYVSPLPGTKLTFRESMAQEHPSPQQWPHRLYAELVQADVLPPEMANGVIDCMRAYGATTLGVVANVGRPNPNGRAILGFISYGYAQMLLRLDRVDEYLLFLYSHRFHDHSRGSWTAGEVSGIAGGTPLFCIPAQQTIPLLTRWMLVSEDSEEERLHFGRALPMAWVASGKEIRIDQAPTRWGRVNFRLASDMSAKSITAHVELPKGAMPKELSVKFRLPKESALKSATVNGRPAKVGGMHNDCVIITPDSERQFEIAGQLS
jgi:hypothetical protein